MSEGRCEEYRELASGYADEQILRHGLRAQPRPLLNKPFSGNELRRAVRAMLDAPGGQRP